MKVKTTLVFLVEVTLPLENCCESGVQAQGSATSLKEIYKKKLESEGWKVLQGTYVNEKVSK